MSKEPKKRRWFQFSLRTLFVAVALAGIAFLTIPPMIGKLPLEIVLKHDARGQPVMYLGDRAIDEADLKKLLAARQPIKDQRVNLSVDKTMPYAEVVKVMDQLASLGLHNLSLNTNQVGGR